MSEKGFFRRGVSEMMVARPDAAKGLIVFKHPDRTIPMYSQLTVEPDEQVLFFRDGKLGGVFKDPGRFTLETSNLPFLSNFIDSFTDGNVFIAEAFFVTTREIPEVRFGGRIGDVEDPKSGIGVATMVHGTFALKVVDPERLVIGLLGLGRADDNEAFLGWFRELVLKVIRERIAELLVDKGLPILHVTSGALTSEVEEVVLEGVRAQLGPYGLQITRLGNFVVTIDEKDEEELKKLYRDAAYVRMAGGMQGFQQFAAGKAMLGAGQGGGGHGGEGSLGQGVGLGLGLGMGQVFAQQAGGLVAGSGAAAAAPAAVGGQVKCPACGAAVAAGKFCAECGKPLAVAKRFCSGCGAEIGPAAKFCSGCGAKTA
jgi:membrane protease subunit (stomatin/prohibitin family)